MHVKQSHYKKSNGYINTNHIAALAQRDVIQEGQASEERQGPLICLVVGFNVLKVTTKLSLEMCMKSLCMQHHNIIR